MRALIFLALLPAAAAPPPELLQQARAAHSCAARSEAGLRRDIVALIDYTRPSTEPRLWIVDLRSSRTLFEELVAHGKNSGGNFTTTFSNRSGSLMSSLGAFVTEDTYRGRNGYSLRLRGLEPGVNDNSKDRAIVMHGAPYVDAALARRLGRLGRSWGCPAVRQQIARQLIDTIKGGVFVLAWYPDRSWLTRSRLLGCGQSRGEALGE